MIRLFSNEQAISLRGHIPELAVMRSLQFQDSDYSPEVHGHILVIQEGDDISQISEIGPNGLVDEDGLPTYEFVEVFLVNDQVVYEVVFQIDDSMTIAVIIPDEPWLDSVLREGLERATQGSGPVVLEWEV